MSERFMSVLREVLSFLSSRVGKLIIRSAFHLGRRVLPSQRSISWSTHIFSLTSGHATAGAAESRRGRVRLAMNGTRSFMPPTHALDNRSAKRHVTCETVRRRGAGATPRLAVAIDAPRG